MDDQHRDLHCGRALNSSTGSEVEYGRSLLRVRSRRTLSWTYAVFAVGCVLMLMGGVLRVGHIKSPRQTHMPSSPATPSLYYYATPTSLPTSNTPIAFVSTDVLRLLDNLGTIGDFVSELRGGDRVQILAQSTDGAWTKIQDKDGHVGWARTDRLLIASRSYNSVARVQPTRFPDTLFIDTFDDPESGLGTFSDEVGRSYYQDGEYVIYVSHYQYWLWVEHPQIFMDCEIEVDAHPVEGENIAYGLVFRSWPDSMYRFFISTNGSYELQRARIETDDKGEKWAPYTTITDYAKSDAIHQGPHTNRLRVIADGTRLSLFVNDQFLQSVTDTAFENGRIGLAVLHQDFSRDDNRVVEVHFDNLRVRSLTDVIVSTTVPQVAPTPTPTSTPTLTPIPRNGCEHKHTITESQNLSWIALAYGITITDIVNANGL